MLFSIVKTINLIFFFLMLSSLSWKLNYFNTMGWLPGAKTTYGKSKRREQDTSKKPLVEQYLMHCKVYTLEEGDTPRVTPGGGLYARWAISEVFVGGFRLVFKDFGNMFFFSRKEQKKESTIVARVADPSCIIPTVLFLPSIKIGYCHPKYNIFRETTIQCFVEIGHMQLHTRGGWVMNHWRS